MPTTDRMPEILEWINRVKEESAYQGNEAVWQPLFDYLLDPEAPLPPYSPAYELWRVTRLFQIFEQPQNWDAFDRRLMALHRHFWQAQAGENSFWQPLTFLRFWPTDLLSRQTDQATFDSLLTILQENGFTDYQLWSTFSEYGFLVDPQGEPLPVGRYVLNLAAEMLPQSQPEEIWTRWYLFPLLLNHAEPILDKYLHYFIFISEQPENQENFLNGQQYLDILLGHNPAKYEAFVADFVDPEYQIDQQDQRREVFRVLDKYLPGKYEERFYQFVLDYLADFRKHLKDQYLMFDYDEDWENYFNIFLNRAFDAVIEQEPAEKSLPLIQGLLHDMSVIRPDILTFLFRKLGDASAPLLLEALPKKYSRWDSSHRRLFELLPQTKHEAYYPVLWKNIRHSARSVRFMLALHIGRVIGEPAIPQAQALLKDKKGDTRFTGALILSVIGTETAQAILQQALQTETSDDVRDQMLSGLGPKFLPAVSREAIDAAVSQARQRGKLDQPAAPWLEEDRLPALHWKADGRALDADTLRFFLYRMNRVKNIGIDPEAQPIVELTERAPASASFAAYLLADYIAQDAPADDRWALTLSSIYGSEAELDLLAKQVDIWTNEGRSQMGAWTVTALALNGSMHALRYVELFSRKYAKKYRNVGAAAMASFSLVAANLGISPDELADQLVPDFGFDGLYRAFEAGGIKYRAYIAKNLKLAFIDEKNKVRTSLPTSASAELKAEFKQIAADLPNVFKSLSERLENYLIIQRIWYVDMWQGLFLHHPVFNALAVRLIWGGFDRKHNLLISFRILENGHLADSYGQPIEMPEDGLIGLVHPLYLSVEEIQRWQNQLAQAGLKSTFAQLDRPVRLLPDDEKEVRRSTAFKGVTYPAGPFVSYLEKRGWVRGEIGDAGWINSFYKHFPELGITAVLTQSGMVVITWYDEGEAELNHLSFLQYGTIGMPGNEKGDPYFDDDERIMPFGEVPPIVYSEVVGELDYLRNRPS